jgi:precorrin-6A/cobalt-precorrin-6A reductase
MKLLLLGGTADAQQLAQGLHQRGVEVIYSIAGLVRQPKLECRVISGGFSAKGGLEQFVEVEDIAAIVDATHPYAQRMSDTAVAVACTRSIPVWRYQRPPWQTQQGDDWQAFDDWSALPALLQSKRSVFFTAGQLTQSFIDNLQSSTAAVEQRQCLRTAIRPPVTLPDSMTWIEAIGPFDIDAERALFEHHAIDALVSKNSGGAATVAKLVVARERGVPVFLLRRPVLAAADAEFSEVGQCLTFVTAQASEIA